MTTTLLIGFIVFAIINALFLLGLSFMLWMAVDAAKADKFWWIVLILGLPFAGSCIYYFVEKRRDYLKVADQEESSAVEN